MIPQSITSFSEAMHFINSVLPSMQPEIHAGSDGLDRLRSLLELLDDPQNAHKAVHIAGTSGKGTIAYSVDALLRANGLNTGLTISPFVYDVRERFQHNGQYFVDEAVVAAVNVMLPHLQLLEKKGRLTSRFETFMALTFYLFAQEDLDYIVVETGLGGLMDASNVMSRSDKVAILSAIGFDHMHILGNSLEAIAAQKAGIMHAGTYAITYPQEQEVMKAFHDRAVTVDASVAVVNDVYTAIPGVAMMGGAVNGRNIALAESAARHLQQRDGWEWSVDTAAVLSKLHLPGRFEKLDAKNDTLVILDGAHNPQKIAALVEHLSLMDGEEWGIVLTINTDVDAAAVMRLLAPFASEFVQAVYPEGFNAIKHAISATEFAELAQQFNIHAKTGQSFDQIAHYITGHSQKRWLVCGSFYNLAPIKKALMLQ